MCTKPGKELIAPWNAVLTNDNNVHLQPQTAWLINTSMLLSHIGTCLCVNSLPQDRRYAKSYIVLCKAETFWSHPVVHAPPMLLSKRNVDANWFANLTEWNG